ncbi:hypothetical protein BP6252_05919 [Coleophoma cylindrospora]|uniref:VOC domain-containing protein n=1 Tax=Coleophoma cylindrospora TaxID=1849047 RepID=A0A3D8RL52_9HELO|nr:hypothetical protein BP6252_05919 [Coleophoma cylindrospora]
MSPTFLRSATLVVPDVEVATQRFVEWFDYSVVEQGIVTQSLAAFWLSPGSAGRRYSVLQPASLAPVFLRFVEGLDVPGYQPMCTYGWAATEICVQDVEVVNERMLRSPFKIIGSPIALDGFPTVKAMQVRGPDSEIVYLTEILIGGPSSGLPTVESLIDRPFIMVLACSDLRKSIAWMKEVFGLPVSDPVKIKSSVLSAAYGMDPDEKHELCIVKGAGQTFLELDQCPESATIRPQHDDALPPGVAITTMIFPDFERLSGKWVMPPVTREGIVYGGCRVGMLQTPDGALLEVLEGPTDAIRL